VIYRDLSIVIYLSMTNRELEQIAILLQGKHRPTYNPAVDPSEHIVVTNVDKVVFTGSKMRHKLYRWHTGYPGGLKEVPAWRMHENHPERILAKAVAGMLPKNRLRKHRLSRLRLFFGDVRWRSFPQGTLPHS